MNGVMGISTKFKPLNRVKQGGVLSPLLFTLYIDNLFTELKHCGFGIRGPTVNLLSYYLYYIFHLEKCCLPT